MKLPICLFLIAVLAFHSSEGVLNGEVAQLRPYYAYVLNNAAVAGGGAFITRRHVLTIARILSGGTQWTVGYGATVLNNVTRVTSTIAFIHPGYVAPNTNNLGVILLTQAIDSPLVQPIGLPLPASTMVLPRLDEEGTVVGFNVRTANEMPINTADLRAAYLLVRPENECSGWNGNVSDTFCARDQDHNANVCTSSVGNPFVTSFRGNLILTGLLTQIELFCIRGDRSLYVQTQNYLGWIRSVANINN